MTSYRLESKKADGGFVQRGTAWAIEKDLVVTAFHVVADDSRKSWLHEIADIGYWLICDGEPSGIALEAVSCDSVADIALLRLASPTTTGCPKQSLEVLSVGEWGAALDSKWSAPGYPSLARNEQVTLTGTIKAVRSGPGGDVFELHVAEGSSASWAGASGSPVRVVGRVVAIIISEIPDAATQDAVTVQPVLSLLRLVESASLQTAFHDLVLASPKALLEALAVSLLEYDCNVAPHSLVGAIVAHGLAYGVRGMLSILKDLPDTPEKRTYTSELLTSTFDLDLIDWPRKPPLQDKKWERHAVNAIPLSLQDAWRAFLAMENWHTSLSRLVTELKTALGTLSLSRRLLQRLDRFGLAAPSERLCDELWDLIGEIEIEVDVANVRESDPSVHDAIVNLQRHIHPKTPRNCCFFLMGSSGAGKTYFLEWLMKRPKEAELILPVAWPTKVLTPGSLEGEIMAVLFGATGRRFATLAQFQEALDRLEKAWVGYRAEHLRGPTRKLPVLIIAFDNMQTVLADPRSASAACAAVQALIEDATRHGSIRWLFMLQHTFFDKLTMPVDRPSFWREYGWIDDDTPASAAPTTTFAKAGWLDLDRICVHDGAGQAILSNAFGAEWNLATLLDGDRGHGASLRNEMLQRYVALPWFSLVLASMGEKWCHEALRSGDLNYIRVVEELHKKKVEPLNDSEATRMQLRRYVRAVAAAMLSGDGRRLHDSNLQRDVATRCSEARMPYDTVQFYHALEQLIGSSLMNQILDLQSWLEVEFVMLWGYEGAKYLEHILAKKDWDTITERLCAELASASQDRLMLKESALEFLVMVADQNGNLSMIKAILALAPHRLGDSAAAILFAAPKLGRNTQKLIGSFDVQPVAVDDAPILSRRLLLAKMMFAEWADPAAFTPAERLAFVRTQYRNIGEVGFASYYLAVARSILDEVTDITALGDCLLSLNGCERAGLAEPLAWYVVDRLFDLALQQELEIQSMVIEAVRRYAMDSNDCAKADYQARRAPRRDATLPAESQRRSGSSWDREFFREWMLHCFCTRVVNALKPVPAFHAFVRSGWFKVDASGDLRIEMEREATLAIGHHFHGAQQLFQEGRHGVGKDFIALMRTLVDSDDPEERMLAFNLMWHTKPTGGRNENSIHHSFVPMIERLAGYSRIAKMKRFEGLYRSTLGRDLRKPRTRRH